MSCFPETDKSSNKTALLSAKFITIIVIAILSHTMPVFAETNTVPNNVIENDESIEYKAVEDKAVESKSIEYKLSLSAYSTKNVHANDINLRLDQGQQRGWIAYYKEDSSRFEQLRIGYERTDQIAAAVIDSSLQAADHGFFGGSITATIGEPFFGIIGYGRTNLKPYANLNFDPNDAITLGAGYKNDGGFSATIFLVRDNRVMPGQQNLHLLLRLPLQAKQRLTLDLFNKSGPADQGQFVNGTGASVTYDWPRFFLRLAYDPKVNFTQENMTRASIGMHF